MKGFFSALVGIFCLCSTLLGEVTIERRDFHGWSNCFWFSNGTIELMATSEVGPRILQFSFVGERNLLALFEEHLGQQGGDRWRIYGGHRLWHSPEDRVRTYVPDNDPVHVEEVPNGLRLRQPVEVPTGIEKSIEIVLDPGLARVRVVHTLKNTNLWAIELAAWALTVMDRGGFAITPLPRRHHPDFLLPNRSLSLWPYTDMQDDRYIWGKDHVLVRQNADKGPTKIGVNNDEEWLAYYLEPFLFVKRFSYQEGRSYPDFQSSVEIYTNQRMLEVETLSPLTRLEPGEELVHEEIWELHRDLQVGFSEEEVVEKILPLVHR